MASETQHKIPVINFSEKNLKPGLESWVLACKQVQYGLEEYGCFEIVYDEFPVELHRSIFGAAKDLLDLPLETKMQKATERPGAIGYAPPHPKVPFYESIGIDCPNTLQGAQYFTKIMWPQGNDTFSEVVHSCSKRLAELGETSIRMVLEIYGVERLFDFFRESLFYNFRFFKYRERKSMGETDIGLMDHTDSSFITILHQHQVEGLQIKTKDGQWIDVKPSSSSFTVLAGDALMAWSNDRVRPSEHHVILKENKERYSVGFFAYINGEIQVPKELVDDESPLRYKPFDHFGYNRFYVSKEARDYTCRIKAFCGI